MNFNATLYLILIVILLMQTSLSQYASMNCYNDNAYVNEWLGYHDNVQSMYFVNGENHSYHHRTIDKEDRQWK